MKKKIIHSLSILLVLCLLALTFAGCGKKPQPQTQTSAMETRAPVSETTTAPPEQTESQTEEETEPSQPEGVTVDIDGTYTGKEEVAAYIHEFNRLPSNFITKNEAKALGWVNSRGNLWDVAEGKSIGGDRYGNYEKSLPEKKGRKYYECDIGYEGGYRGSERIIYSNDGLIYYTADHYNTFELLYGEE